MTLSRTSAVAALDLRLNLTRPLFWMLILMIGVLSWGLSTGHVRMGSGDTTVGGMQAWITSEYAVALILPMMGLLVYGFFVAVASGMAVPRDDEHKVQEMLHSTRLTPGEYIGGKFSAALATFLIALLIHVLLLAFFNHILPNSEAEKIRGPFHFVNYVRPALLFILPTIIFICGVTFAVGEWSRKPILIFVLPVALFLVCAFFLWTWSPTWLDPKINHLLMMIEPTGFRWINETWMKVDRGIEYYNKAPVGYDGSFYLNRLIFAAIGFLAVGFSSRHFASTLRGPRVTKTRKSAAAAAPPIDEGAILAPVRSLGMKSKVPGFLSTVIDVARFEAQNLRSQPGLYLFVPIILLQTIGDTFFRTGAFETPLLLTPGIAAVMSANTLTLLVCLLLLFYTVESVLRERNTGLAPIVYATPSSTAATLFGKSLANGIVAGVILLASLLGAAIVMLIQGKVAFDLKPFLLVWGALLLPTYLVWSSFVIALLAITGNRYTTYSLALAVLILTGWLQFRNKMNWVGNWDLWSVLTWTDFGSVAPNKEALLWNRLFYLSIMVFLIVLTVKIFPRREHDSTRIVDRLRPRGLGRQVLRLLPFLAVPILIGFFLNMKVLNGFQGRAAEKRAKDYWGRNFVTWAEAKTPFIAGADIDLTLEPQKHFFKVKGTYQLTNPWEKALTRFPMSTGDHFDKIEWTLNGKEAKPDNRSKLYVFTPETPIAPGDTIQVGFSHEGYLPKGFTKNGRGMNEFILKEGVVLTSFSSSFLPMPFMDPERGIKEDENKLEPRDYEKDFYEGITKPAFGGGASYPVRMKVNAPEAYEVHSVGVKTGESVENGRKTVQWETDHPVNFFNVVAAQNWAVHRGEGTEIYYYPKHQYNVEEMGEALDAARKYYSEWFYPYPWKELRLNEFPGIDFYAQGFPANITFSEGIGFLTRSNAKAKVAFLVTSHEAAHQWWGNILLPGEGPGGNILSEGMAHYSTILLMNQVKGESARIEFCKRIEERYGDRRQVDSEKALVWIDGSKAGDETTTYDKGGWVFWMLHNLMGAEASRAGVRDFIGQYASNVDHPVMQDFLRVMRSHAPDSAKFADFEKQWFFEVVAPEYKFTDAKREGAGTAWTVHCKVKNAGTGTATLDVAAVKGERFAKQSEAEARQGPPPLTPDWRESRQAIVLAAGEEKDVEIPCDFEPDRVLVDPDALVLQLNRKSAVWEF